MSTVLSTRARPIQLICPDCQGAVAGPTPVCENCAREFEVTDGVPLMHPRSLLDNVESRQRALYDAVAHEYDDVFHPHVAGHYLEKRTELVKELLPLGGLILDVGCGTGALGASIAAEGFDVFGIDLSPAMVLKARRRGLTETWAGVTTAIPIASGTFDLAITVATLHHLETTERVAQTVGEMARVVRPGGFVVLWDHNPANPYWPILMKRVPQDSGDERLVPLGEMRAAATAAGLRAYRVFRCGFTPDFLPAILSHPWKVIERVAEATPGINLLAAHNVFVGKKV